MGYAWMLEPTCKPVNLRTRKRISNKRQENFVWEFQRLLVQLRPNNKQIRLWGKSNSKNPKTETHPPKSAKALNLSLSKPGFISADC